MKMVTKEIYSLRATLSVSLMCFHVNFVQNYVVLNKNKKYNICNPGREMCCENDIY